MGTEVFDATVCTLGEGPLWHPARGALFWFDVLNGKLFMRSHDQFRHWLFDDIVSAAGWVDRSTLLIASETGLLRFDIESGARQVLAPLEADNPDTRSNDGRADPFGGFWIGTMGKTAEMGAGAIYRYYRGQVRKLFADISIPNAIAFAPDKSFATFCDSLSGKVMRVDLDPVDGWPTGTPKVFLDLRSEELTPDGAVFDADGRFWLAQWGASRIACYTNDGSFLQAVSFPTPHTSCPAFGGEGLSTLFCTSAQEHLDPGSDGFENAGKTYQAQVDAVGLPEHQVVL
ncbi:MAG: SMP-30/gluconolactonase/LRE family protein [Hyphomicrobiales bacterium]